MVVGGNDAGANDSASSVESSDGEGAPGVGGGIDGDEVEEAASEGCDAVIAVVGGEVPPHAVRATKTMASRLDTDATLIQLSRRAI